MSNPMKVNAEGSPADQALAEIYQSMPDLFDPSQWKMVSEAGVASSSEYDFDIRHAIEEKIITMFVPAPDKKITYSVYKLESGDPFRALRAMDTIAERISFDQAKGMIELNLTGESRDVIVLFPNSGSKTVAMHILKKHKSGEVDTSVDHTKKDVDMLLRYIADPAGHDWTTLSSTLTISNPPQKKGLEQIISNRLDNNEGALDIYGLSKKNPKDPRGFLVDKKPVPYLTDKFGQIDTGVILDTALSRSYEKPNPTVDFTYDPEKIPDWIRRTFHNVSIPTTKIPLDKAEMFPKIEKDEKK